MIVAAGAGTATPSRPLPCSSRPGTATTHRCSCCGEPCSRAWANGDLPAGYLDPGESFEAAARREAREESGIEVELLSLAGIYHSPPANAVTAVYRARAVDPAASVSLDFESSEHAWMSRSEIDAWIPRIAFGSMASAIEDWAAERRGEPRPDAG